MKRLLVSIAALVLLLASAGVAFCYMTQLSRYIILEQIGSGGMGQVYAAYDPSLERKVETGWTPTFDGSVDLVMKEISDN